METIGTILLRTRVMNSNNVRKIRGILKEDVDKRTSMHAEIEPMYQGKTKVPDMMNFKAFPRSVISKHSMPRASQ